MADYSSDANLIKGAGAAYKNWENNPAVYAGLDKVVQGGKKLTAAAIQEMNRRKQEAKTRSKARKDKLDAQYSQATEDIRSTAITMGPKEYEFTQNKLRKNKEDNLVPGINLEDGKEKDQYLLNSTTIINSEKEEVLAIKDFKQDIAGYYEETTVDGRKTKVFRQLERSAAMNASGFVDGNNGIQLEAFNKWLEGDFELKPGEKGERIYTIKGVKTGNKLENEEWTADLLDNNPNNIPEFLGDETIDVEMTWAQIQEVFIPKDYQTYNKFQEIQEQWTKTQKATLMDLDQVSKQISDILPSDVNGMRAFMADDFGYGETFFDILIRDKSIDSEVLAVINTNGEDIEVRSNKMVDSKILENDDMVEYADRDNLNGVDAEELANFKLAIVDPYHSYWTRSEVDEKSGETVTTQDFTTWMSFAKDITVQKLTNAIDNRHRTMYEGEGRQLLLDN